METIKFTQAKTETLKQAITLLDSYRHKATLKMIKESAAVYGLELTGRTFKDVYPQLVEFYEMAMIEEEAATLVVA
jgi:hypothetical protein